MNFVEAGLENLEIRGHERSSLGGTFHNLREAINKGLENGLGSVGPNQFPCCIIEDLSIIDIEEGMP